MAHRNGNDSIIDADFVALPPDDGGEPRCAAVLLLDTSGSMEGEAIAQLNAGLRTFRRTIQGDGLAQRRCEVAVVTFGGSVRVEQDFILAAQMPEPRLLVASGDTPMGGAIERAIDLLRAKKAEYRATGRAQYRPWLFLITDGCPTDDVQRAIPRVHQGVEDRSFLFFSVGCCGADMQTLARIAHPSTPPAYLSGLRFEPLFQWLSDSLGRVAATPLGGQAALPAASGWMAAPVS